MSTERRSMITLELAGEVVTDLVEKNAQTVLLTRTLGRQRQTDSRNVLSESMFNRWELVSMLAVAIDRLAIYQALTPTPSIEQGIAAFEAEVGRQHHDCADLDVRKVVEAVLAR